MALFGLRYVFEMLFWGAENRVVCVPGSYVQSLREAAIRDAAEEFGQEKSFLSEGDVLCAWWARLAISRLPRDSNQTVMLMNVYGLRKILAKDLLPEGRAYISNAVLGVSAFLPVRDIFAKPLSYVALAVRRSIAELGTREQIEAAAALNREAIAKTGYSPMFGDASMHMINFSNWTKAKFFDTDFSAAVVKEGKPGTKRLNKLGTPSYVQPCGYANGFDLRNAFPIAGKDAAGNWWLSGFLRKGAWAAVDAELKNIGSSK
jgi:hypothetical protein